jgi:hypothetical protein
MPKTSKARLEAVKRYAQKHPDRVKARHAKWREANRDKVNADSLQGYRTRRQKRNEIQFKVQGGRCAICRTHLDLHSHKAHGDHDHKTGKKRGLLCRWCNLGLGHFQDSISSLRAAISYLRKYK